MKETKVIEYDSPEAAIAEVHTLYKSAEGTYHMTEGGARTKSATHKDCKCGVRILKSQAWCNDCRIQWEINRYNSRPYQEWDGITPVYSELLDEYFQDSGDLECKIEDIKEEGEDEIDYDDLMLIPCTYCTYKPIDSELWTDVLFDDGYSDTPKDLEDLIKEFNEKLSKLSPGTYVGVPFRTSYKPD